MVAVTRSHRLQSMDTSRQVMSPNGALAGNDSENQARTSPADDDTFLRPEDASSRPQADDVSLAHMSSGVAAAAEGPSSARIDADACDGQDVPPPASVRNAVLAACNSLGPRELLGMLLDQVEHRSRTNGADRAFSSMVADNQPRTGSSTGDDRNGAAHASQGVDGTHPLDLSTAHSPIGRGTAMANGSDPPSSSSSSVVSATNDPARNMRVHADAVPEVVVTGLHEVASQHTLMEAKNRAMLSREIKVIELDGHKKYDAWKQDLQLKLNEWGLMEFLEGTATLDADRAAIDPNYAFLFGERKTKSFSALALSLSIKLREEFKGPIKTQDPAALYTALKVHFERGKENPIYLKREFYSRMLGRHEAVQQYIDGLRAIRHRIAESGDTITENELGRTILSNCVDVYPTVAIKHTEWAKSNTAVNLDVQEAVIQLETAEQAQRESKPITRLHSRMGHVGL
ncbi:hypothetical protein PF003_g8206 [Phytophthora fragariae]|nr:hypothetical protein PF003_g8206 [Phytophthora fragariae]